MKQIEATVVKVVPSKIEVDEFDGKRYEAGNHVIVQEIKSCKLHTFINGSMNEIPESLRKVGIVGNLVGINLPAIIYHFSPLDFVKTFDKLTI